MKSRLNGHKFLTKKNSSEWHIKWWFLFKNLYFLMEIWSFCVHPSEATQNSILFFGFPCRKFIAGFKSSDTFFEKKIKKNFWGKKRYFSTFSKAFVSIVYENIKEKILHTLKIVNLKKKKHEWSGTNMKAKHFRW